MAAKGRRRGGKENAVVILLRHLYPAHPSFEDSLVLSCVAFLQQPYLVKVPERFLEEEEFCAPTDHV